jgi:hypothetical protein
VHTNPDAQSSIDSTLLYYRECEDGRHYRIAADARLPHATLILVRNSFGIAVQTYSPTTDDERRAAYTAALAWVDSQCDQAPEPEPADERWAVLEKDGRTVYLFSGDAKGYLAPVCVQCSRPLPRIRLTMDNRCASCREPEHLHSTHDCLHAEAAEIAALYGQVIAYETERYY